MTLTKKACVAQIIGAKLPLAFAHSEAPYMYTQDDLWYDRTGRARDAWLQTAMPDHVARQLAITLEYVSEALELSFVNHHPNSEETMRLCLQKIADTWKATGRNDRQHVSERV